jgi:serine phosphatase RsbU (regulator of sigma subunit)
MPLLDGTERLGVLDVVATDRSVDVEDPEFRAQCDVFAQLVGHLVATKIPYGDILLRVRRTRRMSEASELVWKLLPPLTFSCHRLVIAAVLEPCYEVGGDGFDYAVDGSGVYFAVFDTAGHDLRAGLGTATVLSASRAARRDGDGLCAIARAADLALVTYAPELCFTTAVLAHLDLDSGLLRYINAGHPQPLLLRQGKVVRRLGGGRRMPLGLDDPQMEIAEETLEPDDRLVLFTDGVTDARDVDGVPFGEQRLVELVERQAAANLPAPEALRTLCHAALDRYDGPPTDDATLLMVEWSDSAVRRVMP